MTKHKPGSPPAAEPIASLIEKYLRQEKRSKALFHKQLALLDEIIAVAKRKPQTIQTKLGKVELVDRLKGRNVLYKTASFPRFELKLVAE